MRTFVFTLLLSQSLIGFSQYSLKGVVKDYSSSKNITIGVSVIIDTTYNTDYKNKTILGSTVSGKNGEFRINNIAVKKVNLILYYVGCERLIINNIKLKKNATTDIGEIRVLAGPLCTGSGCKDGDIKNRHKKIGKEIKLRYPKKGKKIKVKIKEHYILINYEDIIGTSNK